LFEGGVVGANGHGDVVDHIAVVRVAGWKEPKLFSRVSRSF